MIRAFVSLVLVAGLVLAPAPALAVSMAECEAYLCLPGGFPPSECTPAKAAVLRRLAALQPATAPVVELRCSVWLGCRELEPHRAPV